MQRNIRLMTALAATLSLPAIAQAQTTPAQRKAILNAHNVSRALHCVPPLQWSAQLAANAQSWANGCHKDASGAFCHQGQCGPSTPYGENLSWAYRELNGQAILPGESPEQAVQWWYGEINNYDFNNPFLEIGAIGANGHFTQLVWRASTQLGCAQATCSMTIGGVVKKGTLWVCEYYPPGNFNANPQTLAQNVPRLCN